LKQAAPRLRLEPSRKSDADSAPQPAIDGGLDEAWGEESQPAASHYLFWRLIQRWTAPASQKL
jgi:hypothetical protein